MKKIKMEIRYRSIEQLIDLIHEPYQSACFKILNDNRKLFETARGSTYNHQTWVGGYIDHITDGMNYLYHLYIFDKSFGRTIPFSLSDALLIFFLHDLEKPWRIVVNEAKEVSNRKGLETKDDFQKFREQKIAEYGIHLTPEQKNALTYIEGEYKNYSSTHRVMNELAAFCHKVDVWCARGWYNYPKADGDEWCGAGRFRKTQIL